MASANPSGDQIDPLVLTRKTSTSNRFEINKVEETSLNKEILKKSNSNEYDGNDESAQLNNSLSQGKINTNAEPNVHPSALKKTVKHYLHDDDFFDLDSEQNSTTAKDRAKFLRNAEKQPLTSKVTAPIPDDPNTGCFQINYDERNKPSSLVCNLSSNGVSSYANCFHDFKTILFYQKLFAEFLGTLVLTLYACSIGLPIVERTGVPSINGCLGGGLTLATLIWCLGNVSGGHFNPAVTLAFLIAGKINPILTFCYIGAQLVGGLTGAYILKSFTAELAREKLSVTLVHPDINLTQAYFIELIITFILVLTIFSCVDGRRNDLTGSFPLQIGFAVAVGGLFGGQFTGGSMNPARSFGPALAMGIWKDHYIYWAGPISGAAIAALIYQGLLTIKCPRKYVRNRMDTRV